MSARTSAEILVSVKGEPSLFSCSLCQVLCSLQSSAAPLPPCMVPVNLWPNQHCYSPAVLQLTHMAQVQGVKTWITFFPVVQVSVLTDQVEAQGEKIRDLEFCLEEHREKLNATEEMLQQVFHSSMSVLLSCLPSVLTNFGEISALQGVAALDVS